MSDEAEKQYSETEFLETTFDPLKKTTKNVVGICIQTLVGKDPQTYLKITANQIKDANTAQLYLHFNLHSYRYEEASIEEVELLIDGETKALSLEEIYNHTTSNVDFWECEFFKIYAQAPFDEVVENHATSNQAFHCFNYQFGADLTVEVAESLATAKQLDMRIGFGDGEGLMLSDDDAKLLQIMCGVLVNQTVDDSKCNGQIELCREQIREWSRLKEERDRNRELEIKKYKLGEKLGFYGVLAAILAVVLFLIF